MTEIAAPEQNGLSLLVQLEEAGALTATGLHLAEPDLTYSRFEAIGFLLGRMHESLRFAIGDWLLLGEAQFPEEWTQASEALGLSEEARREYMRVSQRVPRSRRRKGLTWSHHRAVAALPPPEQKEWLRKAEEQDLSHHALREALRDGAPPKEHVCRCCHRPY